MAVFFTDAKGPGIRLTLVPLSIPLTHDLRVHDYHDVLSKIFARLLMEFIYSFVVNW